MAKNEHKMEPRYTLKLAASKAGKAVYLHNVIEEQDDDGDRVTLYWQLYPSTMYTRERLEQLQQASGCGGRIVRNGEVPCIPLVPA